MPSGLSLLHLRSIGRTGWRSLAAIAVLFGLSAGLALASVASARRTDSAYDRLLAATRASDLSIDYGTYVPEIDDALAALPGVESSSTDIAFNAAALGTDGRPRTDIPNDFEMVSSLDGRFFDQDRVSVIRGRLPDPTRTDEIAVNESAATTSGFRVGDDLTLGLVSDEELDAAEDPNALEPATRESVTVVGEILFNDEIIQDENDRIARILATPAFTAAHVEQLATYAWQGLHLAPGVDAGAMTSRARDLLATKNTEEPGFILVRTVEEDRSRVERAVLPQTTVLFIVGLIVGIVAIALVQQAAIRLINLHEDDLDTYRTLGMGPRSIAAVAAAAPLLALAAGALLAVGVAAALSPLSPLGALHDVEIDPGVDVDWTVLAGGVAALVLVTGLGILLGARAGARRIAASGRTATFSRRTSPLAWVQSIGAPLSVSVGAQYAVQPQSGPRAAPVRTVAIGATVAVTALVAALCFGSSVDRLVRNPKLYGWNWDLAFIDQAGYGAVDEERAAQVFRDDPMVEDWAPLGVYSTVVDRRTVPVLSVRARRRVGPEILSGRMIERADEVVLGRTTMRTLHKEIGDTVEFGPERTPLRIVGTATLPAIGQVHSSHPSPGEGAITFADDTLSERAFGSAETLQQDLSVAVVRLRPGVDPAAARQRIEQETFDLGVYPGSGVLIDSSRPAEITNARSIRVAPAIAAALLTLAALLSLSLALVAAVRRRRGDLAALKALGFTRRQLGAAILTQSLVITGLGIAIGVPAGVIGGRWLWSAFADRLSVVNSPSVPIATLVAVIAAVAAGAVLVAVVPSQLAARVQVGDDLRRD